MNEVIFSVEEDSEGGYVAQALSVSIVTQSEIERHLGMTRKELISRLF